MTSDIDRPAVWVIDPDGTTRHEGREHGRMPGKVLVLWDDARGLRFYRWINERRVIPRDVNGDTP